MKRIRNVDVERVFTRKARQLLIKNPSLEDKYKEILSLLIDDPFNPFLKTHPLHGKLKGRYACSLTDDLRIVFKLSSDTLHLLVYRGADMAGSVEKQIGAKLTEIRLARRLTQAQLWKRSTSALRPSHAWKEEFHFLR